jgi:hypothetical protein
MQLQRLKMNLKFLTLIVIDIGKVSIITFVTGYNWLRLFFAHMFA